MDVGSEVEEDRSAALRSVLSANLDQIPGAATSAVAGRILRETSVNVEPTAFQSNTGE